MHCWGYTRKTGPHTWAVDCSAAGGQKQSPIDIDHDEVEINVDDALAQNELSLSYDATTRQILKNSGHAWQVDVMDGDNVLSGGPLEGEYRLKQFHCHWGANESVGSEHTVNGKTFSGEIHLVHWNSSKYDSFEDAAKEEDGLAVLGILLQSGDLNSELEKVCHLISEIRFSGDAAELEEGIDLKKLIPDDRSYWTYSGSLTTPPCSEVVTWILLENPIELHSDQLYDFRTLLTYKRGEERPKNEFRGFMLQNYRSPMPVRNRQVRKFQHTQFV